MSKNERRTPGRQTKAPGEGETRRASRSVRRRGRRGLALGNDHESYSLMVQAARLLYQLRMTQSEAAKELNRSQATVSRLIEAAHLAQIIHVEIKPAYRVDLQDKLKERLKTYSIREVVVVPRGSSKDEKNTLNLGPAGAQAVLSAIEKLGDHTVSIALACGETLRAVVDSFIELARRSDPSGSGTRTLEFFPTTLHADYQLKAVYPATLVTSLSMVKKIEGFAIEAYATSLPAGFRALSVEKREAYLKQWRIRERILDKAAAVNIFVLGVGTTEDPPYEGIVGDLRVDDWEKEKKRFKGEVMYTPIDLEGQVFEQVAKEVVGVTLEQLKTAASTKERYVIGVAGGAEKKEAVEGAVRGKYLNILVTDEDIAEHLLAAFPVSA